MYVFRLGIISSLLSETLVSGFTTGAGIHVLVSQIKDLIGIRLTPIVGNFKLVQVNNFVIIYSTTCLMHSVYNSNFFHFH